MIDIDTMQAGREMDALVAERVMGDVIIKYRAVDGSIIGITAQTLDQGIGEKAVPLYSTDIAAAWPVHIKMCNDGRVRTDYLLALQEILLIRARLVQSFPFWPHILQFIDETAICRAAMKAVMIDKGERHER